MEHYYKLSSHAVRMVKTICRMTLLIFAVVVLNDANGQNFKPLLSTQPLMVDNTVTMNVGEMLSITIPNTEPGQTFRIQRTFPVDRSFITETATGGALKIPVFQVNQPGAQIITVQSTSGSQFVCSFRLDVQSSGNWGGQDNMTNSLFSVNNDNGMPADGPMAGTSVEYIPGLVGGYANICTGASVTVKIHGATPGINYLVQQTNPSDPGTRVMATATSSGEVRLIFHPSYNNGIWTVTSSDFIINESFTVSIASSSALVHNTTQGTDYCSSIQLAIDQADPNDHISVDNGTFYEHLTIGTTGLVLQNSGISTPVIDGNGTGNIVTISANNITLQGFTLQNSGQTVNDAGILLGTITGAGTGNGVTGCLIQNNTLTTSVKGIALAFGSGNTVKSNTLSGNGDWSIMLGASTGNTIESNAISGNTSGGIYLDNQSAFGGTATTTGSTGNQILNNTIANIAGGESLNLGENCNGNTVNGNILDGGSYGIHIWKSHNQSITGNTLTNFTIQPGPAKSAVAIRIRNGQNNTITGNTITDNMKGFEIVANAGETYCTGNQIHNNDISGNGSGIDASPSNGNYTVDAVHNWWGSSKGPNTNGNTPSTNPCGDGNGISLWVNYEPWCSDSTCSSYVSKLTASASQTNVNCNGGATGSVTITAANGISPYQYKLGDGSYGSDGTFSGLAAGSYTVWAKDASNCEVSVPITITQLDGLSATVTRTNRNLCQEGSILISSPLGGSLSYEYSITDPEYWSNSGSFTGLTVGNYPVKMRDAVNTGCVKDLGTVTIENMPVANISKGSYFATIQAAIDAADPGDEIHVCAGTYTEDLTITKSVILKGPNAGISPNTGSRVDEAIIYPVSGYTAAWANQIISLTGSDIIIDGFTLDGDNPSIGGTGNYDASQGITGYTGQANVNIGNNILRNFSEAGVILSNDNGAMTSGNTIHDNKIDNISPAAGFGIGVYTGYNTYTDITDNNMTNVRKGIQGGENNYRANTGNVSPVWSGNVIQSYKIGIWNNLVYGDASPVIIQNNTITTVPGSTINSGIEISSVQGTRSVTVENNSVTGAMAGINLWNNPTTALVTVGSNVFTSCDYGVFANNYDGYNSNADVSAYVLNGVQIVNPNIAGVFVKDNSLNTNSSTVGVQVQGSTSVSGSAGSAFLVQGAGASIVFNGTTPATISGMPEYIVLNSNGTDVPTGNIDATTVVFDGKTGAGMTLAELFAAEDKIDHKIDLASLGLVTVKANNDFVTVNSYVSPNTTPLIQRGIDAASSGWTVNVGPGTFSENVTVNKSIQLLSGFGSASSIIDGLNTGSELGTVFLPTGSSNVRIGSLGHGFTIKGLDGVPAVEKSAVYLQGTQSYITIEDNVIEARGDEALMGEWNASNDHITINANSITGQTFIGTEPASGDQFTVPNVARQAVVFGGGASTTNTQNFSFTNNTISTITGVSTVGNGLVTLDLVGSNTITGNLFTGQPGPYSWRPALRVRGTGSYLINNNSFTGNYQIAIERVGTTVDGTCNWYGTADGDLIALKLNGNVTYSPWLNNGVDDSGDPGFQPVAGSCSGTFPVIAAIADNIVCGDPYGSIVVQSMTGGTPPYTIHYCTGTMAPGSYPTTFPFAINNLPAGPCSIYITDANGTSSSILPLVIEYLPVTNTTTGFSYRSIQAAINAADPGEVIEICPGTYSETLLINKSIHLQGKTGEMATTIIKAPPTLPVASDPLSSIIIVSGSGVNAEISGLTIAGPGPSGCGSIGRGIFVRDDANADIHDNQILDIRDNPFSGCQNGIAIQVGRNSLSTNGTATITNNIITGYQKGAIVVDKTGSHAVINGNTITGIGTTSVIAQNGIQISRGATASLSDNLISGNSFHLTGNSSDWGSCGILLYQSGSVNLNNGNNIFDNDQNYYASDVTGTLSLGAEVFGPSSAPASYGYQIINSTGQNLDASACIFEGVSPSSASLTQLFALEDKIWHSVDNPTYNGFVRIKSGNVYVTPTETGAHIQYGIDAASAGDMVNVQAGDYGTETASNRMVFGVNGPHQFGLFIDKDNLTVRGYKEGDVPAGNASEAAVFFNTGSTANFGPSGIFVQADGVMLEGLKIGDNYNGAVINSNKTVEVVGDAFVMNKCFVNTSSDQGAIYLGRWEAAQPVESYSITNNLLNNCLVSVNNGIGLTEPVTSRQITGNEFTGVATPYLIGLRGWNGTGAVQGWILDPVGGAVIKDNAFNNTSVVNYFIARGNTGGYDNSQLNWSEIWNNNTYGNHVVTLADQPVFSVRSYTDAAGYTDTRRISALIQENVTIAQSNDVVLSSAGTFKEDVKLDKVVRLQGQGCSSTIIEGPIGGDNASVRIAAAGAIVDGFSITRAGNNPADWDNAGLNSAGLAVQGQGIYGEVRNCCFYGNRSAIDINNSNGNNIHDNTIDNNRTGLIFRNQTDNTLLENNFITNNWTGGVLFLDASSGTNSPVQSAINSTFTNNNISGNWYGDVVDRQAGGSLPAPGSNIKNFECNWYGLTLPTVSTANSAEPGYSALIPACYGGTAVPPVVSAPNILGPASANVDYISWLMDGTDDSGSSGFQPVEGSCNGTPVVLATPVADHIICGETTGSIAASWTGGLAPYSIALDGAESGTTSEHTYNISGLSVGTYTITVTDANGSSASFGPVEIKYLPVTNVTHPGYYATIQSAIDAATAGDVLEVCSGTYNYVSEGSPAPNGLIKVTKGVTIRPVAGSRPLIDGSGFDGVFKIHPSALSPGNTVVIEGFEIKGDATTGIAMTMQGCFDVTPAKVIIRNNWFHGMVGGIDFWGAGAYLPSGWTSGLANIEITGNRFYDMVVSGTDQGFGVMIEDPVNWTTAGGKYAVTIENNDFVNLPSNGSNFGVGIAIPRANDTWEAANVKIAGNYFANNVPVGVAFLDGDVSTALVTNNSFNNPLYAILTSGIDNPPVSGTCNWWGTSDGDVIPSKINGSVNYSPWLSTGTDISANVGFQPVEGSCNGTPVVLATPVADNIICGETTGSISVSWTGGTAPFTVLPAGAGSGTTSALTYEITGLSVGTYTVTVTDANGSSASYGPVEVKYLPVTNISDVPATYYATIQEAINAADPGEEIHICEGVFTEQLHITKNLTLDGAGNSTIIKSPAVLPLSFATSASNKPVVFVDGANNAIIKNMVVDGDNKGNANYRFLGIAYWNAGGAINNVEVVNIMDTPFSGAQHGNGIYADNNTAGTYTLNLDGVAVSKFQKNGITLNGNGNLTVSVNDASVTGEGATSVTAQNGIQVWGASGSVTNSTITGINYTGTGWLSTGLLVIDGNVNANAVNISNSLAAVCYQNSSGIYSNSTISNPQAYGILMYGLENATYDLVLDNISATGNLPSSGYGIYQYAHDGNTHLTVQNSDITNWEYAIFDYVDGAGSISSYVSSNNLSGNTYGFVNYNAPTVQNAQNNWWGAATGPYNDPYNLCGTGSEVYGNVNFDPWWTTPTGGSTASLPIHNITTDEWYCTIQDAINAASAGNVIKIEVASHTEGPQILVDKNITLQGLGKSLTTLHAAGNTGSSGDSRGWIVVNPGVQFNMKDVTLDGTGYNIYQGVRNHGTGTVDNVTFNNISYPGYMGTAVVAYGNMTVQNSEFTNIGRLGIIFFGTTCTNGYVDNITYTGKGSVDRLDYAVEVGGGAVAAITNSHISGNIGVASSDGSTSAGVLVSTYYGSGTTATITGCTFTGNTLAIAVGYDETDVSVVVANNNTIAGNDFGISSTATVVDAKNNWWGSNSGPSTAENTPSTNPCGTGDKVSLNVDYSPWYFQSAMTTLNGLPGLVLSDIPDITTIAKTPLIISETVTYPDLSGYDPAVLTDALITSSVTFPTGSRVIEVEYNDGTNSTLIPVNFSLDGKTQFYLSDILGNAGAPLVNHSNLVVTWKIKAVGFETEATYPVSFQSLAYLSKAGCSSFLGNPENFNVTFHNVVDFHLNTATVASCTNSNTFTATNIYGAILNVDPSITMDARIASDLVLPAGTLIDWKYNTIPGASYTLGEAANSILLSTIVGGASPYPLVGANGLTDNWEFTIHGPGLVGNTYNLTISSITHLGGVEYTYYTENISLIYHPVPTMTDPADQVVCNNSMTSPVAFAGTLPGTSFTWVNDTPGIGLPANGSGNIGSFVAINSTTGALTATVTVTPWANGCSGIAQSFTITAAPQPDLSIVFTAPVAGTVSTGGLTTYTQTVCSGSSLAATPATLTPNDGLGKPLFAQVVLTGAANLLNPAYFPATFEVPWDILVFNNTLINTTGAPLTVTAVITPYFESNPDNTNGMNSNECQGTPISFSITVNPATIVTDAAMQYATNPAGSWNTIPQSAPFNYSLCLNEQTEFYYLDAVSVTMNPAMMQNHVNGFKLNTGSLPGNWTAYWTAKGVTGSATPGSWQAYMYQIITGAQPMFYMNYTGTDYQLIDGLQYQMSSGTVMNPLRVNGDYPAWNYSYSGSITDVNNCVSSFFDVFMDFNTMPTATISGTQSICSGGSATLSVALTGIAPWSLTYTANGTNPVTVDGITSSPYALVVAPAANTTYMISEVTDATGCSNAGTGSSKVMLGPVTTAATVMACPNTVVSVPLTVRDFDDVEAVSLTLDYDAAVMTFAGFENTPSSPISFNIGNFQKTVTSGTEHLRIAKFFNPTDLADNATLVTLKFNYSGGNTSVAWNDSDDTYCEYGFTNNELVPAEIVPFCDNPTSTYYINGSVTQKPATLVNAGPDQTICAGQTVTLAGLVSGGSTTGVWSGGTGTFTPDNTTLNATYTPGVAEVGGPVVLTLTSTNSQCTESSDQMTVYVIGAAGVNMSDIADISTVTATPVIVPVTVTYPDLTAQAIDPTVLTDARISTTLAGGFPAGSRIYDITYNGTHVLTMPYTFGSGVNSVYLSDILGSTPTSLLGHSGLTVNWKLYIDGITAPESIPVTVEAVAYLSKTGCNAVLDSDNLTLTLANASLVLTTPPAAVCYPDGVSELVFTLTHPAINPVTGEILSNAKIISDRQMAAGTKITAIYNYGGTPTTTKVLTLTTATNTVYLSEIVTQTQGNLISPNLFGHTGPLQWKFLVEDLNPGVYNFVITAEAQLPSGTLYPYAMMTPALQINVVGATGVDMSDIADISTVTSTPVIVPVTVTYPDLAAQAIDPSVLTDARISTTLPGGFPSGTRIFAITYNGTQVLSTPYIFSSGVSSVYLSDILGNTPTSLLGHSGLTVNWKLYIDGVNAPVSIPVTVEAVAYMSKTGCNAVLDSDNLMVTMADASLVLTTPPAAVCYPDGVSELIFTLTHPAINPVTGEIFSNATMVCDKVMPAGTTISYIYNYGGTPQSTGTYVLPAATNTVYLSEIVTNTTGNLLSPNLFGHTGSLQWKFTVGNLTPGVYNYTIQAAAQLPDGTLYPYATMAPALQIVVNPEPMISFGFNGVEAGHNATFEFCEGQTIAVSLYQIYAGTAPFTVTYTLDGGTSVIASVTNPGDLLGSQILTVGPHNLVVTDIVDANGCHASPEFLGWCTATLIVHPAPVAVATITSPVQCFGGTGTVTITPTVATAPITYTLGSVQQIDNGVFTGLIAGTYNWSVTDIYGCGSATGSIEITEPTDITLVSTNIVDPSCYGGNGTITLVYAGGTGTLSYTIGGETNATGVFIRPAGTYAYSVTDANSCGPKTGSVTVGQPTEITLVSTNVVDPSCYGGNGNITLVYTGGTGTLSYTIGGETNTTGIFSRPAGTYIYSVTDAKSCGPKIGSVTVGQPADITLVSTNVVDPSCYGGNGTITLVYTGGTGTLSYTIGGETNTTGIFSRPAGTYIYSVTDAKSCGPKTGSITVGQPADITLVSTNVVDPSCYGGNGTITLVYTGGTGTLSYTIGGETNTTGAFSRPAGTYSYSVTDAKSCGPKTGSVTVGQPADIIQVSTNVVDPSCYGGNGTITLVYAGGTGTLSYTIGSETNNTGVFSRPAGIYTYSVTDANSCGPKTGSVTVGQPADITLVSTNVVDPSCYGGNGTITLVYTGGTGILSYTIGTETNITGVFSRPAGTYSYSVTDAKSCGPKTGSVTVGQPADITLVSINVVEPMCNGGNGTVTLLYTGGTGILSYTIGAETNTTGIFSRPAGTYSYSVTDAESCGPKTGSVTVTQPDPIVVSGSITYYNAANSPLNGATVTLWQGGTSAVYTANITGNQYTFPNVCPGTYELKASFTQPGGSVNATDAAQVNAWGVGPQYSIEKVRFFAGDVIPTNTLDAGDAGRILQYFLSYGNPGFVTGAWTFWKTNDPISAQNPAPYPRVLSINVPAGSTTVTQDIYGMAMGDFNRSYTPSTKSVSESLSLGYEGTREIVTGTLIDLPVKTVESMEVGAISMILNFPSDKLEVLDVTLADKADQSIPFSVNGDELRIGWYSKTPVVLPAGSELVVLKVRSTSPLIEGETIRFSLVPDNLNELADGSFDAYSDAKLTMEDMSSSAVGTQEVIAGNTLTLANQPNPFKHTTTFTYNLPLTGKVTLEVSNMLGARVMNLLNEDQASGKHTLTIDTDALTPGVYLATMRLNASGVIYERTIKIIRNH